MLTLSQHHVYQFIRSYLKENDYAPTTAEIAAGIGIKSRGVVHRYLKALADKGYIFLEPNRRRNIRLCENSEKSFQVPLLGSIAAGRPIEAIAGNDTVDIAAMFLSPGRYALRVKGESMLDEGIYDGDVIICEQTDSARNGQIVVALIDNDSATLKRFKNNEDGTITLFPANVEHSPQIYECERVKIQGVFVGLIRMSS